jgi:hypothetical protein
MPARGSLRGGHSAAARPTPAFDFSTATLDFARYQSIGKIAHRPATSHLRMEICGPR